MNKYPYNHFIETYAHNGSIGVLVEFRLETQSITKNAAFRELSKNIAMHIAASPPVTVPALLEQAFVRDPSIKVREVLATASKELAERITITRLVRWDQECWEPGPPSPSPEPPRQPAVIMRLREPGES